MKFLVSVLVFSLFTFLGNGNQAYSDVILRTYQIVDATEFTLLGSARQGSVTLPAFDSTLGELRSVAFRHQLTVTMDARSTARGGVFLPPTYISSYTWSARSIVRVTGVGLAIDSDERYTRFGNRDREDLDTSTQEIVEEYFDSGTLILDRGDFGFNEFETGPVVNLFYGHTVEFPPLSPFPAGFAWDPSTTITGAGIAQFYTSQIDVLYDFAPIPEPTNVIAVFGILTSLFMRRKRSR